MSDEGVKNPEPAPTPPSQRRLAEEVKPPRKRKARETALVAPPSLGPSVPEHLKAAHDSHQYKMGLVGGLSVSEKADADIKAWADRKAVEMLPAAMAEINFALKFGNDKQRQEAADRVLDMHGLRKREAQAGNHATIVLNLGGDKGVLEKQLPWLSRTDKASEGDE